MLNKNDTKVNTEVDIEALIFDEVKKRCGYIATNNIAMLQYLLERKENACAIEMEEKFMNELEDPDLRYNLSKLWQIMYGYSDVIPADIRYKQYYHNIIRLVSMEMFIAEMQLLTESPAPNSESVACAQYQHQQYDIVDGQEDDYLD